MKETENSPLEKTRKFLSSYQGNNLIKDTAIHLSALLGVDHVIIGKVQGQSSNMVETVAFYSEGAFRESQVYSLKGTPSENILSRGTRYYPSNVKEMFPDDPDLQTVDAQSYLGTPLVDSGQNPVGLIILIHSKTIKNPDQASQALNEAAKELQKKFTSPADI